MSEDKRDRITVDITGLKEKLTTWTNDPKVSTGSLVRSAIVTAIEFWEAVENLGLPRPKPGNMQEWLLAISGKDDKNTAKPSIAQLIKLQNLSELSEVSGISEKRLKALAQGAEPLIPELSLLDPALNFTLEDLYSIYKRDFPDRQHKQRGKPLIEYE
ncbi:hypothetical protein [Argonema antarcticum]|uniref:hypothetical protein n=1 Tax=Argonema antarcticum TaxID=2942763 RepID=UPI0020139995|nr:hypothetical protein [Argonema antarcticum]MCL1475199.1 hypothetical protein [Argonema antarcticum A004/B2]